MKRRIPKILFLILLLVTAICGLTACNNGKLNITVENSGNGTVELSAETAEPGEDITVTMTPDSGYCVESVLVNDSQAQVEDNKTVFAMPNTDVTVKVTFGKIKYKLNVNEAVGGQLVYNAEGYAEGENVTLTVEPDFGYRLTSLKVDGKTVEVSNNKYTFAMPASGVTVVQEYSASAEVKPLPAGSVLTIKSLAPAGGEAQGMYFLDFGSDALTVTAYVSDEKVIAEKDGVFLYFGTSDKADGKITDKNTAVLVYANGESEVRKGTSGGVYGPAKADGFTADCEPWSAESGKVTGYIVTVTAEYAVIGATAETAQSKLTLLPVLANSDKAGLAFGATEASIDEYYISANADTYPLVNENGFTDNYYMFGTGEFGSYKNIVLKGQHWNTSGDNGGADRKVSLEGHNGDNDIALYHTAGKTSFATAKFKITNVYNKNDKFPKFGFMVYDTAKTNSGIFFYADAEANKASDIGLGDIVGTSLGYSKLSSGNWNNSWKGLADTAGSLNLANKEITLSVCYNKGFVYMYCGNKLVGVTTYRTEGDIVIGVKCFGLGLELTGYKATNDASDGDFLSHCTRADGDTVGDNESGYAYTEGWSIVGDIAVNFGTGDQILYIKGATENKTLYAEASVTSPEKCGNINDAWTKAGAVLINDNYTIFGYIDLADNIQANNRVQTYFAVRPNGGNWTWETGVTSKYAPTIEDKSVVLGIAKLGSTVYLTADGKVVATYTNNAIENEKFVAGILGMNRSITATAGYGTNNEAEVKAKLDMAVTEEVTFDGVLDDAIWTEQVLSTKQTFAHTQKTGTRVEAVAVKGGTGVFASVTLYTKTMQRQFSQGVSWSDVTNVNFKLADMTENDGDNSASHFVAFYNRLDGGVSSSVGFRNAQANVEEITLTDGSAGFKTTVEFFIPYKYFANAAATELPFYVWTCSFDDENLGAMNSTYKTKGMYVTDSGLIVKSK